MNKNSSRNSKTLYPFQIELWQKYINWEKSNPLKVEDPLLIAKRVMFAFEQCLLCMAHHPNIWYEAALFLQESSKVLAEKGVSFQFESKQIKLFAINIKPFLWTLEVEETRPVLDRFQDCCKDWS